MPIYVSLQILYLSGLFSRHSAGGIVLVQFVGAPPRQALSRHSASAESYPFQNKVIDENTLTAAVTTKSKYRTVEARPVKGRV